MNPNEKEETSLDPVKVYQIKAVLKDISPMIWRRFLMTDDTTVAQLHTVLQTAMDWSDECLHQFRIHGKDYCIPRIHGLEYYKDARKVHLRDFRLRPGERFSYTYNMRAPWEFDLRVEQVLEIEPKKHYPLCLGGKHAGPDEFLEGPEAYRKWCRERNSCEALGPLFEAMASLGECVQEFLEGGKRPTREDEKFMEAHERIQERIQTDPECFDRRKLNAALRKREEPPCTSESN